MKPTPLVCVGDACVDWVVRLPRWPAGPRPQHGRIEWIGSGGSAANVASTVARLGGAAALIASVGRDPFAGLALSGPRAAGVDLSPVRVSRRSASGVFLSARLAGGVVRTVAFPASAASLSGAALRRVGSPAAWFVSGHLLHSRGGAALARTLRARVRRRRELIATDLTPFEPRTARRLLRHHPGPVLLFTSLEGSQRRRRGSGLARRMLAELGGATAVAVVKLGAAGSWIAAGSRAAHVPALKAAVIDALGAGDAYVGAFVWGWQRGLELEACGLLGSAAGALCVSQPGTQGDWLSRAQMMKRLTRARLPRALAEARRAALRALDRR